MKINWKDISNRIMEKLNYWQGSPSAPDVLEKELKKSYTNLLGNEKAEIVEEIRHKAAAVAEQMPAPTETLLTTDKAYIAGRLDAARDIRNMSFIETPKSEDLIVFVENARELVDEQSPSVDWVDLRNLLRYTDALKEEKSQNHLTDAMQDVIRDRDVLKTELKKFLGLFSDYEFQCLSFEQANILWSQMRTREQNINTREATLRAALVEIANTAGAPEGAVSSFHSQIRRDRLDRIAKLAQEILSQTKK